MTASASTPSNVVFAAGCALGLSPIYERIGPFLEGIQQLDVVLQRSNPTTQTHAWLLQCQAWLLRVAGQMKQAGSNYEQALVINREIGNRRNEGLVLGNLGDLFLFSGQASLAQSHFEQAIVICDELFPAAAGAFRGSLALIVSAQGDLPAARRLLACGEEQLRGQHRLELGKLLCKRGTIEHSAGDLHTAHTARAEASDIVEALEVTPDSELGKAVTALQG